MHSVVLASLLHSMVGPSHTHPLSQTPCREGRCGRTEQLPSCAAGRCIWSSVYVDPGLPVDDPLHPGPFLTCAAGSFFLMEPPLRAEGGWSFAGHWVHCSWEEGGACAWASSRYHPLWKWSKKATCMLRGLGAAPCGVARGEGCWKVESGLPRESCRQMQN